MPETTATHGRVHRQAARTHACLPHAARVSCVGCVGWCRLYRLVSVVSVVSIVQHARHLQVRGQAGVAHACVAGRQPQPQHAPHGGLRAQEAGLQLVQEGRAGAVVEL